MKESKSCKECAHYLMCRFSELLEPHECKWFADESLVVTLPCRIGDTVYAVLDEYMAEPEEDRICEEPGGVKRLCWDGEAWSLMLDGDTVALGSQFAMLTREEAEECMRKMKKGEET